MNFFKFRTIATPHAVATLCPIATPICPCLQTSHCLPELVPSGVSSIGLWLQRACFELSEPIFNNATQSVEYFTLEGCCFVELLIGVFLCSKGYLNFVVLCEWGICWVQCAGDDGDGACEAGNCWFLEELWVSHVRVMELELWVLYVVVIGLELTWA